MNIVNEMNQLRKTICEKTNRVFYPIGMVPEFTSSLSAANWLRSNGHPNFTQQSFRGLLEDITGRKISQEEADQVRVLSGVAANWEEENYYFSQFAMEEEKIYLEELVKFGKTPEDKQVTITKTILGWHIDVSPVIND